MPRSALWGRDDPGRGEGSPEHADRHARAQRECATGRAYSPRAGCLHQCFERAPAGSTPAQDFFEPHDHLPAERGSGYGCGGAEVFGWFDEAPLVECRAVGEGAPVAETGEVERPDIHDRLEPAEFVVGRLYRSAVGVDGSVDPLLVRPTRVPRTRAPDQVSKVGEARPASGCLPVDRD